jgi:hypothetical protein
MTSVSQNENKRLYKITFRLSSEEKQRLELKLKEASLKPSEFLRLAITATTIKARFSEEERRLMRMLTGLATNLNQVAKQLNSEEGALNLASRILSLRREIDSLIQQFQSR